MILESNWMWITRTDSGSPLLSLKVVMIRISGARKMRQQEDYFPPRASLGIKTIGVCAAHKKSICDDRANRFSIESTVIWIGKDSESQSNEYLEECNTHQCGE